MEPAGTPPPGIEGLSEKQRELMAKQHQAAKEQRKRDEDRLLEVISGACMSDCGAGTTTSCSCCTLNPF